MGLRRLRARLDGGEAKFHNTMDVIQDLVADLSDGVGIKAVVDWDAATEQIKAALTGKLKGKHPFPVTFIVDPTVDKE